MNNKLLSLLGLARRAGKLEAGYDAAVQAARGHKAKLMAAARDISDKTFKNLRYEAEREGIPAVRVPALMSELSKACGIRAGVAAVTDEGFAKAVLELTKDEEFDRTSNEEECTLWQ